MRNIQLPEDILEVILLRLQVIDLLRLKSVCKRWYFLISSSRFIHLHLKKAISCPSDYRILTPSGDYKSISIYEDQVKIKDLPLPRKYEATFLGSCDGLICFLHYKKSCICVWNPATRSKSLKAIKPLSSMLFYWFGHDPVDHEYKFMIGDLSRCGGVHMHIIRPYADEEDCDSAQLIYPKHFYYPGNQLGTLFNGRIHCFVEGRGLKGPMVCSYDLRLKTLEEVPSPDEGMDHFATMCVMNGCLSAFQTRSCGKEFIFEVWMMKEYGVKESWIKSTIYKCGIDMLSCGSGDVICHSEIVLVGITAEGDLIVRVEWRYLVLCNLRENKCKTLSADYFVGDVVMYVETLVSPRVDRNNWTSHVPNH